MWLGNDGTDFRAQDMTDDPRKLAGHAKNHEHVCTRILSGKQLSEGNLSEAQRDESRNLDRATTMLCCLKSRALHSRHLAVAVTRDCCPPRYSTPILGRCWMHRGEDRSLASLRAHTQRQVVG